MDHAEKYQDLLRDLKLRYPRFKIVQKDESWLAPIFFVASLLTRTERFVTTIGSKVYVPYNWNSWKYDSRYITMRHEAIHIEQFHSWPLGPRWKWLNHFLVAFCYLFILPVRWTIRARLEQEAYAEGFRAEIELRGPMTNQQMEEHAVRMAEIFGGPSYLWMWNRKDAYAWAMRVQRELSPKPEPPPLPPID